MERCLLCDEALTEGQGERRVTLAGTAFCVHPSCVERLQRRWPAVDRPWDQEEEKKK